MDASDRTTRRKGRTMFADRTVQQALFDKGRRIWIAREGGVNSGAGAMTYQPNYYTEQAGAVITSPEEFNALIVSVPNKFPDAPTNVTAALVSGNVVVSFSPPAYAGTAPISSYTVISNPGGIRVTGSSSPITVTGLSLGETYTFTVIATNAAGSSSPSAPSNSVATAAAPDAATDLGVIPSTSGATVYFTEPDDGGSAITNYEYSTDDGVTWTSAGTTTSPVTVIGLTTSTASRIKLRAVNIVGPGAPSVAVTASKLTTFYPPDLGRMNVWLDGHAIEKVGLIEGQVSAWNDSSPANNHFAASATGTITYDLPSGINGRPALNFTTSAPVPPGQSTYLSKNVELAPTNELTVFLVVRQTGRGVSGNCELFFTKDDYRYYDIFNQRLPNGRLYMNEGSATQLDSGFNITSPPTNAIISVVTGASNSMFLNGATTGISGATRGGLGITGPHEWSLSAGAFLGNYGEVICYSTPLSEGDRQSVEGYLAWKWGLQESLPITHPCYSAPPARITPRIFTIPDVNTAVTIVSESPFVGGGRSYKFNGTSSFLNVRSDDSWDFGTGDFTIEWFQYQTDNNSFPRIFAIGSTRDSNVSIQCSLENSPAAGSLYAWFSTASLFGSVVPYKNVWRHFAIVRQGTTLSVYRDGVQLGSSKINSTNISNSLPLYFGVEPAVTQSILPSTYYRGNLTNIRFVKGLAVYTGPFVMPTSALTAEAAANPYGGANTQAIPVGYTKLLFAP